MTDARPTANGRAAGPVVVIGGSAGSIEVLREIVAGLPADFDAPVLIVVHLTPDAPSRLCNVLERRATLPVHVAGDGEPMRPGHIYVAPPDRHLTIVDGELAVRTGPRQNRHRPAIDPLFRSAARAAGSQAVAVVLSGALGDGVSGARVIAHEGGVVVVQDPAEALFPSMPELVMNLVPSARVAPRESIATMVVEAVESAVERRRDAVMGGPAMTDDRPSEGTMAGGDEGRVLTYGCPDCGGVLRPIFPGDLVRFRCRVGHEYEAEALLAAQEENLEDALWAAIRGLEEKADLGDRVAQRAPSRDAAERHRSHARDARDQAETIRAFLMRRPAPVLVMDE